VDITTTIGIIIIITIEVMVIIIIIVDLPLIVIGEIAMRPIIGRIITQIVTGLLTRLAIIVDALDI